MSQAAPAPASELRARGFDLDRRRPTCRRGLRPAKRAVEFAPLLPQPGRRRRGRVACAARVRPSRRPGTGNRPAIRPGCRPAAPGSPLPAAATRGRPCAPPAGRGSAPDGPAAPAPGAARRQYRSRRRGWRPPRRQSRCSPGRTSSSAQADGDQAAGGGAEVDDHGGYAPRNQRGADGKAIPAALRVAHARRGEGDGLEPAAAPTAPGSGLAAVIGEGRAQPQSAPGSWKRQLDARARRAIGQGPVDGLDQGRDIGRNCALGAEIGASPSARISACRAAEAVVARAVATCAQIRDDGPTRCAATVQTSQAATRSQPGRRGRAPAEPAKPPQRLGGLLRIEVMAQVEAPAAPADPRRPARDHIRAQPAARAACTHRVDAAPVRHRRRSSTATVAVSPVGAAGGKRRRRRVPAARGSAGRALEAQHPAQRLPRPRAAARPAAQPSPRPGSAQHHLGAEASCGRRPGHGPAAPRAARGGRGSRPAGRRPRATAGPARRRRAIGRQ